MDSRSYYIQTPVLMYLKILYISVWQNDTALLSPWSGRHNKFLPMVFTQILGGEDTEKVELDEEIGLREVCPVSNSNFVETSFKLNLNYNKEIKNIPRVHEFDILLLSSPRGYIEEDVNTHNF